MRVLVTGGAGYIGSVITDQLVADGHTVVVYDNLSKGHREAVARDAVFVQADLLDEITLLDTLRSQGIEAVMHMAASSLVGESMTRPDAYYRNNVIATLGLLRAMVDSGVRMLVFSSTAAVYGEPERQPIVESDALAPSNTYGETKLAIERALRWYHEAHAVRSVALRYFNAAGATALRGERHDPETHLIPLVLKAAQDRRAPASPSSAMTTRRATARASATTCTSRISQPPTSSHSMRWWRGRSNATCSIWAAGRDYTVKEVIDTATQVTGNGIFQSTGGRAAAAIRRCPWPAPIRFAECSDGAPHTRPWSRLSSRHGAGSFPTLDRRFKVLGRQFVMTTTNKAQVEKLVGRDHRVYEVVGERARPTGLAWSREGISSCIARCRRSSMRVLAAGIVLGVGLGGFVDGITFHQIMQWHNMGSAILPPHTMEAMAQNMVWDGMFHAATLLIVLIGVFMLWREGQSRRAPNLGQS